MKTRLTHIRVSVSDLNKAIAWYENILGFECLGADITDRWQYAQFTTQEGADFSIMVAPDNCSNARFNFKVNDVDALYESLSRKVIILEPIETMPYGNRKFTITDPDGNELGFVQENYGNKSNAPAISGDWSFKTPHNICNFRSAGVLIKNNKVLLQREKNGSEYALPGGHVKIGETASDALIREFKEEADVEIICKKLLWVEELFWNWNNIPTHTIAFYHLIELCGESCIPAQRDFISHKDNCDIILGWIPLNELNSLTIYPEFLKERIYNLNAPIEHFVTKY